MRLKVWSDANWEEEEKWELISKICFYIDKWNNILIIEKIRFNHSFYHEIEIYDSFSYFQEADLTLSFSQRNRL